MSTFTGVGTDGVMGPRGFAAHFRSVACDREGCVPFTRPGVCVLRNRDGVERRVVVKPGQFVKLNEYEDVHHWEWPEEIPGEEAPRGTPRVRIGIPVPDPAWPVTAESYHQFIEELCENIPEEWDDDIAVEGIILDYVRHLESLVPPEQRLPTPR